MPAASAGEASTHFSIFVPPNNDNNGRNSVLTVTAHSDNTSVDVTDTLEDGDSDDSYSGVTLNAGQSLVIRLRDGAINDDAGGDWEGDRLIVDSDKPVTAMLSTHSEWQHDWVPAEGGGMRGQEFFVWSPRADWELDAVAYEDNTLVEIYDVTTAAKSDSGTTSIALPGEIVLRQTINDGQDFLVGRNQSGVNITEAGHTYRVIASEPITLMFGSFFSRERDGGGYVPSENGTTSGTHFYFPVPAGSWTQHEKEIRVVAGDTATSVTLRGYDTTANAWVDIETVNVAAFGHADFTGRSHQLVRTHKFFEVEATADVNVFEANWLETGRSGTSDVYTFVSALDGIGSSDVGTNFVAYLGPPGFETRYSPRSGFELTTIGAAGTFSHLFVSGLVDNTTVQVQDVDTAGTLFSDSVNIAAADDIVDIRVTSSEYDAMSSGGNRPYVSVTADHPISVGVANWNDNWLAYASGVQPETISIEVDSPESPNCNSTLDYDITVTNNGTETVSNIILTADPVGDVTLLNTPTTISSLAPAAQNEQTVQGVIDCATANTGEAAGIGVTGSGSGQTTGNTLAARDTTVESTVVPNTVGITAVAGEADACTIEVEWTTDEDTGGYTYEVLRREFGSASDYAVVGAVASVAPAVSGFLYGYRDVNVQQNITYQYMIRVIDDATSQETSIGGPVIVAPGKPFVALPGETANLAADFADVGTVISDPVGDVTSTLGSAPGYDVDSIAVAYDKFNDALYLAVSATGVFGDGDGDGDPDTNDQGAALGLTDRPDFSVDEQFAFVLDLDQSGQPDAVVGIPFGADLDYLQAAPINQSIGLTAPTIAFEPLSTEQDGEVVVSLLTEPDATHADLELVVYNASALHPTGSLLGNIDVAFYMTGPAITSDVERTPDSGYASISEDDVLTAGCGTPPDQFSLGMFAVFGNVFSGTPDFDFIPYGWSDTETGSTLIAAPDPVPGTVITSPTYFTADHVIDISGTLASGALDLPSQTTRVTENSPDFGRQPGAHSECRLGFLGGRRHTIRKHRPADLPVDRARLLRHGHKHAVRHVGHHVRRAPDPPLRQHGLDAQQREPRAYACSFRDRNIRNARSDQQRAPQNAGGLGHLVGAANRPRVYAVRVSRRRELPSLG